MSMYTFELTKEQREGLEKLGFIPVTTTGGITTNVKEDDTSFMLGNIYYYLMSDGIVEKAYWVNTEMDDNRQNLGNAFRTKEEAEFMRERLKVIAELRKYAKGYRFITNSCNWCICYVNEGRKGISTSNVCNVMECDIYFASQQDAQAAIDNIGETRLKKYYFMVED